jgi:hypothetical protein
VFINKLLAKMEPIVFGKKRALLVKPIMNNQHSNKHTFVKPTLSRHSEIIDNLRNFVAVRMWEKEKIKWDYESLQQIKETPYLMRPIPEKRNNNGIITDCPDYFFFLTTLQNRRICCFIEKKKPLETATIYQVRFRFKDELFAGTLLTGTLLMNDEKRNSERLDITAFFSQVFTSIKREISAPAQKQNWLFVTTDILAYSGKDVSTMLPQRLVLIQDIIGKDWYPDSKLDVCDFEITTYNNFNSIEDFLRNKRKYYSYNMSDSKIVIVCTHGIPCLEEYSISLKNPIPKPLVSETITFKNGEWTFQNNSHGRVTDTSDTLEDGKRKDLFLKMSDYPDVYWVYNPESWKKLGAARVRTLEESKCLKELFTNIEKTGKDYLKITCKWMQEFEKWQPILKSYIKY